MNTRGQKKCEIHHGRTLQTFLDYQRLLVKCNLLIQSKLQLIRLFLYLHG